MIPSEKSQQEKHQALQEALLMMRYPESRPRNRAKRPKDKSFTKQLVSLNR